MPKTQAIKYETTTVGAAQSAGEIADLVRKYGGSRFEMRWGEFGELTGVRFAIRDQDLGEVPVRLEAQTDKIRDILQRSRPWTSRTRATKDQYLVEVREQAYRIAWRQLKDFVEQALLAVETGLFPIGHAFMASIEMYDQASDETVTMAELFSRRVSLAAGDRGMLMAAGADAPTVRRLPPPRSQQA